MNQLSEWLSRHAGVELWVASLIAIALMTIVANQIAQVLLRQAARVTARTATVWDEALVSTASRPILAAMWVLGASFMARVLQRQIEEPFVAWYRHRGGAARHLCTGAKEVGKSWRAKPGPVRSQVCARRIDSGDAPRAVGATGLTTFRAARKHPAAA